MPSVSQLLIAFLSAAALVACDEDTQASTVNPTVTGYGYDVSHRNYGQLQSQYGYQRPVTGFRAGTSWPYNQDQYNAYGNKNRGQYTTNPTAYGNRYSTFGTTGYPQSYPYANQGTAYNPAYGNQGTAYNPAYGNQGTAYNPAYGNQGIGYNSAYSNTGTAYNPAYGIRYQANPAFNRPINAYGSQTPTNPYNTPFLNAYSGQTPGFNNAYGSPGYRNIGYQYNTASSTPFSSLATSTPKYNTFGTTGYSYNPSPFGGTGYGYNSVGFGATGQDYNTKYSTGSKQLADGRYSGVYGSQSFAKPLYQNQFTSPTYAPTNTGYGK